MAERTGLDARTPETCICAEDKWAPLCPVHGAPGKAHFTSKNRSQWADILSRCHAGTYLYAAECRELAALLSEAPSPDETADDSGAELVAMLLPYLQQWQCADAAELEAKALLTERTERYLAGFAPKAKEGQS